MTKHIINGIWAFRFGAKDQRVTKTNLFKFFWNDRVPSNVLNSLVRPEEVVNLHEAILSSCGELKQERRFEMAAKYGSRGSHMGRLPSSRTDQRIRAESFRKILSNADSRYETRIRRLCTSAFRQCGTTEFVPSNPACALPARKAVSPL